MKHIVITLLLIIILLNFKDNKKEVKNKHNKKEVKNKLIGGSSSDNYSLKGINTVILGFAFTIIIYFILEFANAVTIDIYVLGVIFIIVLVISGIVVFLEVLSFWIIKFIIFVALILSVFSSLLDVSASASYSTGCSVERFFKKPPQIEVNSISNTAQEQGQNIEKTLDINMSPSDIEQVDKSKTSLNLGNNFEYTTYEWNEIKKDPKNWKKICMNLHNRSHVALKETPNDFFGRLNITQYSLTSWIGWVLNHIILFIIFWALAINEKQNTLSRLNVKEPKNTVPRA